MKKVLYILICCFLSTSVHAGLNVFACEPEWVALASELGGDKLNIYQATSALQDPHHIDARPSLIAKMRHADLVVCTGAGLEVGWLPLVIRQSANDKVLDGQPGNFAAAMQVERLEIPQQVDRSMGDVHPEGNPHVQLDPVRMLKIAAALSQRLIQIDPANSAWYQQRHDVFSKRWQTAIAYWENQAKPLKGMSVAIYHKDWVYLFAWLGIKSVATLEPKAGIAPSAGYLAQLKQELAQYPASMVIYASYQNGNAARWLSDEMHIPLVELPFTVGGNAQAKDLFTLFDDTLQRMLKAQESKK